MAEYQDIVNVIFVPEIKQGDTSGLTKTRQELDNTDNSSQRVYRSLQQLGMTTWFLSIGVSQVTNTLKIWNRESEIGTAQINLLQQTLSSMTYGFYAMTHMTRMGLETMTGEMTGLASALGITASAVPGVSLAVGALFAVVTGIIPVIKQWNNEMEKAYANVTKTGTQIQTMFKQYFDATNILEVSNALAQINAVLGKDFVEAVKSSSNEVEAFNKVLEAYEDKAIKAWLNTSEGKQAMEDVKKEMFSTGEGVQIVTVTIDDARAGFHEFNTVTYDSVELSKRLKKAWEDLNAVHIDIPTKALQDRGEMLEKLFGGKQEMKLYFTPAEEVEKAYQQYIKAYKGYLQEMAKLRGDEEEQFELQLQDQVDTYREAGLSKLQIDEYIKLSRQKHQEEMTQKEIEEVFKREQAEWDAIQKQKQQEQQLAQERENIRKSFESKYQSYMYSELEITERTLREEYNAYIEAGGNIQTGVQIVQSVITNLVMQETQKRIQEIEKERDAKLQALDKEKQGRETLYYRIVELGQNETQNELMELIKRKNEYESYINDKVLLETWFNKEAKSIWQNMWDDYNRQVEEAVERAKQTRIQAEQNINDKIMQLSSSNLQYQIFNLQREVDEYAKVGVSIEKIQEYTSLRIKEIKQQEADAWIEQEQRKLEMQQSAYERYMRYMLEAQGKQTELQMLTIQTDIQDLISQVYKAYGVDSAEMIQDIIQNLPNYIKQMYPDLQLSTEQINQLIKSLSEFYNILQNPPQPPPIEIGITIPEPTDIEKEAKEKVEKPPSWEEFQKMFTDIEAKIKAVNMIIGGWYSSAQYQLRLIYDALIVEEEKKAHTLIQNIVDDITHYDWGSLGISSGSGFGRGFLLGFESIIPRMAEEVAKYFEFHSPPEKGALRNTEEWGAGFILEFIKGMLNNQGILNISLLSLFQQLPFSAYASVVLRNIFAETYPNISKGTPYTTKQLAWYHPEGFFKLMFGDIGELMSGKEIYKNVRPYIDERYQLNKAVRNLVKTRFELLDAITFGITPEEEQILRQKIQENYGVTGDTLDNIAYQLTGVLEDYMDVASKIELRTEFPEGKILAHKYGMLDIDFPQFGELYKNWAQIRQEQGLDNIIDFLRSRVASNFGYNLTGRSPDYMFKTFVMPSIEAIQTYLKHAGLERVGGRPEEVLGKRERLEEILPTLQEMGIGIINPPTGMYQYSDEVLSYLKKIVATYKGLIQQFPELKGMNYEQIRAKMLTGIEFLMTPAMDLFTSYLEEGWQDWMKKFADIQTEIPRYLNVPGISEEAKNYNLGFYELFDIYKVMYQNLPREQGIEFFQKIFTEGLIKRQQYIEAGQKSYISEGQIGGQQNTDTIINEFAQKQTDVLKYALYFLMEQYGMKWEDIVKGIDEKLLTDLFPDLGKIFLQPEYGEIGIGIPGVTSAGGIVINLNFNIENINDVNINDFVYLVATELMKQLDNYIYV